METTFNTTYKANGPTKSSIKVTAPALPIDLHQMIVWIMNHQEDAVYLLLEFEKMRDQVTARNEGSAKNHGVEV